MNTNNFVGNYSFYINGYSIHEGVQVQSEGDWAGDNNYVRLTYETRPEIIWNSSAGESLEFKSGAYSPLRLSPLGKVGINTDEFLGNHSLYVCGTVITEGLHVKLKGVWPDYVFSPDYNLIPLIELADFIKSNGHLPGLPNAHAVIKDGIELGEANRILTEKIEELTLYLIELKLELDQIKKSIPNE